MGRESIGWCHGLCTQGIEGAADVMGNGEGGGKRREGTVGMARSKEGRETEKQGDKGRKKDGSNRNLCEEVLFPSTPTQPPWNSWCFHASRTNIGDSNVVEE